MRVGRVLGAMFKSNDRRFITLLTEQADLALKSLSLLATLDHDPHATEETAELVKRVERDGDHIRRILIEELTATYSTPFDREDLFALSRSIDDIIDAADEAARELFTFNIAPVDDLQEMTEALVDGARHIRSAVSELLDHPTIAAEHAVRAKRSENHIDVLYHEAVGHLFDSPRGIAELLKTREVYRHLKNSADRIDRAADDISMIVIKRS